MTVNLPATGAKLPPLTAINASSLPPQQLARHRAEIAEVVETILSGYWRDDMPDRQRAMILADWCDELENWKVDQIRWALRKWRETNPNKKPNPGHILGILKDGWGKAMVDQTRAALTPPVEPPKDRISDERRHAILVEAGLRDPLAVKTIDGITPTEKL